MENEKLMMMYLELLKENKMLKEELNELGDKYSKALDKCIELSKKYMETIDAITDMNNINSIRNETLDIYHGINNNDDNEILLR